MKTAPAPTELHESAMSLYAGVVYDVLRFDLNLKGPFVLSEQVKPAWGFKQVQIKPQHVIDDSRVERHC